MIWDLETTNVIKVVQGYYTQLTSFYYSHYCGMVITGHENGNIMVWDGPNMDNENNFTKQQDGTKCNLA